MLFYMKYGAGSVEPLGRARSACRGGRSVARLTQWNFHPLVRGRGAAPLCRPTRDAARLVDDGRYAPELIVGDGWRQRQHLHFAIQSLVCAVADGPGHKASTKDLAAAIAVYLR